MMVRPPRSHLENDSLGQEENRSLTLVEEVVVSGVTNELRLTYREGGGWG
jgi:hypothetical protein